MTKKIEDGGPAIGRREAKRISLTDEEIHTLVQALRIAAEDGSLFSDDENKFAEEEPRYQQLVSKLRRNLSTAKSGGEA